MPSAAAGPSSDFRIFETAEFKKALKRLRSPFSLAETIQNYVYPQLRKGPFFGPDIRKLRGYAPDTWRYRIGSYRVFYSIDQKAKLVFILAIDDRKDAYK